MCGFREETDGRERKRDSHRRRENERMAPAAVCRGRRLVLDVLDGAVRLDKFWVEEGAHFPQSHPAVVWRFFKHSWSVAVV